MKTPLFLIVSFFIVSLHAIGQINIETKFIPPSGYERIYNDEYSKFLRQLPLKTENIVLYYDGGKKPNYQTYAAVFNYDIGNKDLHQCADAAIYLNAMFNYQVGDWYKIKYRANSGKLMAYTSFAYAKKKNSFKSYLEYVWAWAGTWSLEKYDTFRIDIKDIKPGDIFIQGGSPGHSITVVDVIQNDVGNKKYMLAQSYMPAQEQHILFNPEKESSVWYDLNDEEIIVTPDWDFWKTDLRRFNNMDNNKRRY